MSTSFSGDLLQLRRLVGGRLTASRRRARVPVEVGGLRVRVRVRVRG
jgi:hypothetical protein